MAESLQAIRGMHDIVPDQTPLWSWVEFICKEMASRYAYREIRFPIVEQTALFHRTIGEVTDIVEKEMYTFTDRNGDSLSLRPEGTASCVRAGIEQGLFYNQIQRLWYCGPMFRHERPQKGRARQFHQFGVEAYGLEGPEADAEIILMARRIWEELGLENDLRLEINTLGSSECRDQYRKTLVSYFEKNETLLDEDSKRRLHTNPLRILDSKNPDMQSLIEAAPKLLDHIDEKSREHFDRLCALLTAADLKFVVNPRLVRGLDYYGLTVFEWVTDALGAQGTVCAGGRYNSLVERLGGKPTPAVGFALGLERLVALCEEKQDLNSINSSMADIYFISSGLEAQTQALLLAEQLRTELPYRVLCNLDSVSIKAQFKRADKSGARWALILGEDELAKQSITLKDLNEGAQEIILLDDLINYFQVNM